MRGDWGLSQWLLTFFVYGFLGWVWESCFVSIRSRKWVNRGFLSGPLLPIYGFGAVIILLLTLPVRSSIPLVYLVGMAGATVLEYVTGAAMERLFHMRYWDYSQKPLNLNGHICLGCSLGWGVFSVLLVEVLHPPVERLISALPELPAEILSAVLLVAATVDVTRSVQAAFHLRQTLERLAENNVLLERVQNALSEASASAAARSAALRQRLEELEAQLREKRETLSRPVQAGRGRAAWEETAEELRRRRLQLLDALEEKAALLQESGQRRREELRQAQERLAELRAEASQRRAKELKGLAAMLRRNPSAASREHRRELDQMRNILGRKKKKEE